jgi:hypothetical protein
MIFVCCVGHLVSREANRNHAEQITQRAEKK